MAGSPRRVAARWIPRVSSSLARCCVLVAAYGCNVYTPDMLVASASGGTSSGGTSNGGASTNGGTTSGSTTNGGASVNGGAATGGQHLDGGAGAGGLALAGAPSGGAGRGGEGALGGAPVEGGTAGNGGSGGAIATGGGASLAGSGGHAAGGASGHSATGSTTASGGGPSTGGRSTTGGETSAGAGGAIVCDATLVDDMHDSGSAILPCSGRNGTWYSFGTDPLLSPTPKEQFKKVAVVAADEAIIGAKFAAKLQGGAPQSDCGMGFTLRVQNDGVKLPYSLLGAKLAFKYRTIGIGGGVLSVAVPLQTTIPKSEGGTCVEPCYNHFFYRLGPSGSTNNGWQSMEIPLTAASDPGFAQNPYWRENIVNWDPVLAMMIQFTVSSAQSTAYSLEVGPIKLL